MAEEATSDDDIERCLKKLGAEYHEFAAGKKWSELRPEEGEVRRAIADAIDTLNARKAQRAKPVQVQADVPDQESESESAKESVWEEFTAAASMGIATGVSAGFLITSEGRARIVWGICIVIAVWVMPQQLPPVVSRIGQLIKWGSGLVIVFAFLAFAGTSVRVGPFNLDLPNGWKGMTAEDAASFRNEILRISAEEYELLYGPESADATSFVHILAYRSPGERAALAMYSLRMPAQGSDYLEVVRKRSDRVLGEAPGSSRIKRVVKNEIVQMGKERSLATWVEESDGRRVHQHVYFNPKYPGWVVGLLLVAKPGEFATLSEDFGAITESIVIAYGQLDGD